MSIPKGKRPRDPNQLAKWIVDTATGNLPTPAATPEVSSELPMPKVTTNISDYMAAIGSKGGKIGGKRRLVTMLPEQRRAAASKAVNARWSKAKKRSS